PSIEDRFGKASGWGQVIGDYGPFDDSTFCFEHGKFLLRGNYLLRAAALEFNRVAQLAPDFPPAQLGVAQAALLMQLPGQALPWIEQLDANLDPSIDRNEISRLKLLALFGSGQTAQAEQFLQATLDKGQNSPALLTGLMQVCMTHSRYSNALSIV